MSGLIRFLSITMFAAMLAALSSYASASGTVGIDYVFGESVVAGQDREFTRFDTRGPGISFSWNLSEEVSVGASFSRRDGSNDSILVPPLVVTLGNDQQIDLDQLDAEEETTSGSLRLSYSSESWWGGVRIDSVDFRQDLFAVATANPNVSLTVFEEQKSLEFSVEAGRDWLLGYWSPSVSLGLSYLSMDIESDSSLDVLRTSLGRPLEENISGTDLSLVVSLAYYYAMSNGALISPLAGVFYRANIDGDVTGVSGTTFSTSNETTRRARSYSGDLNSDDDISANLGVSLIAGDWVWTVGWLRSLSSSETSDSAVLSLNYQF